MAVDYLRLCQQAISDDHQDPDNYLIVEFFSAYLKLQIFPVILEYRIIDGQHCILDPLLAHLDLWKSADIQQLLHQWVNQRRFQYFFQSKMFSEYDFCVKLTKRIGKKPGSINYCMFKSFKERLKDSHQALVQLELWIAIDKCLKTAKKHHTRDGINLQKYTTLRKEYTEAVDNLCLPAFPLTMNAAVCCLWCKETQGKILVRLAMYWWPKMEEMDSKSYHQANENEGVDDLSLLEKIQLNYSAGDPFHTHMLKMNEVTQLSLYEFWVELNEVLAHQTAYTSYEIQRLYMKLYTKYIDKTVPCDNLHWLTSHHSTLDYHILVEKLYILQDEILALLKTSWTCFQNDDYESFYDCFAREDRLKIDYSLQTSVVSQLSPVSPVAINPQYRKCKQKFSLGRSIPIKYDAVLKLSDLTKTPFEGIPDMEVLEEFQQYLEDKYGSDSLQLSSCQLWLSILLHKKMPPSTREHSAKKIYRKFFSKSAKKHSSLHTKYGGSNLVHCKGHKTVSRLFEQIQRLSLEGFTKQIDEFFKQNKPLETIDSNGSLTSMQQSDRSKMNYGTQDNKDEAAITQAEETRFKEFMIDTCQLQLSKQKAFIAYMNKTSTEHSPGVMANNYHFWKEVEKFKELRDGSVSHHLLIKKIAALIENYLDADNPPWIKISIQNQAAKDILEKYQSLSDDCSGSEQRSRQLDDIFDLLAKAQGHIFAPIMQHWVNFNKIYVSKSSTPSRVSSASISTVNSDKFKFPSRIHLSPLCRSAGCSRNTVLSFTREEGLQWSENFSVGRRSTITPGSTGI